jgi:DNA anti-recombination protein RmuC
MPHPDASRRAFRAVDETCPTVDRESRRVSEALDDMVRHIKDKCTEPLRDALIEAYDEVITLEDERDELLSRIESLEEELCAAQHRQEEAS